MEILLNEIIVQVINGGEVKKWKKTITKNLRWIDGLKK